MKFSAFLVVASAALAHSQRPSFAGTRPIGYPAVEPTMVALGDRFGEAEGTTQRLPVEANGDRDLIDRLSKLPVDKQPFWFINWQALEAHRQNPQTYPQKPNTFVNPQLSNVNSGNADPTFGGTGNPIVSQNPNINTGNSILDSSGNPPFISAGQNFGNSGNPILGASGNANLGNRGNPNFGNSGNSNLGNSGNSNLGNIGGLNVAVPDSSIGNANTNTPILESRFSSSGIPNFGNTESSNLGNAGNANRGVVGNPNAGINSPSAFVNSNQANRKSEIASPNSGSAIADRFHGGIELNTFF